MHDTLERIDIITGDITHPPSDLGVDAIVNAANESLLGGGGVDGAIHRAAGPELRRYNETLGGCPTGLARITPGFRLEARGIQHIIHTVGPVWHADAAGGGAKLGDTHEDILLASCYVKSLQLATEHGCRVLAFPAISTGVYGFPKERAAKIAFGHVSGYLGEHDRPERIIFCCFSEEDAAIYRRVIETREAWMYHRGRV